MTNTTPTSNPTPMSNSERGQWLIEEWQRLQAMKEEEFTWILRQLRRWDLKVTRDAKGKLKVSANIPEERTDDAIALLDRLLELREEGVDLPIEEN